MFCPSCGTEYTNGLRYCNRCGANLSNLLAEQTEPVFVTLTKPALIIGLTLTLLTLGGFVVLITGAVELARNSNMGNDPIIALIMMGMIIILTSDIFLVRQLSRLIGAVLSSNQPQQLKRPISANLTSGASMPEFPRPITARLEPAASVTENTTRFFEPAYRAPSDAERETPENLKS